MFFWRRRGTRYLLISRRGGACVGSKPTYRHAWRDELTPHGGGADKACRRRSNCHVAGISEKGYDSMNLTYDNFRSQMVAAARLLFSAGVMSHSGHANMSVRLPEPERLLMTAHGQVKGLTA